MALFKSSSPAAAAALLLATLLLSAAAWSALAQHQQQAPPPEPEEDDDEPGCPVNIDAIIVAALTGKPLPDGSQEAIDELSTRELAGCVCENIVNAAGITSASPGAIGRTVDVVVERLGRNDTFFTTGECNPTLP